MKKAASNENVGPRICARGCGESPRNRASLWCAGHDARYKQRLIAEFDGGSAEAGQELVKRGWMALDALNLRQEKSAKVHCAQLNRLQDRIDRLNEQIARLEKRRESLRAHVVVAEQHV